MDITSGTQSGQVEAPEIDVEYLNLESLSKGVTVRLSEPLILNDSQAQPGNGSHGVDLGRNLMVLNNTFGWMVAADNQGFNLFSLPLLRQLFVTSPPHSTPALSPSTRIPTPSRVDFLRFMNGDKTLIVGFRDSSIGIWRLKDLAQGNIIPKSLLPASSSTPYIDILPCPAPNSPLLCTVSDSIVNVIDISSSTLVSSFPAGMNPTAACWSVKGKQVVVGVQGGNLIQFTPAGEQRGEAMGLPDQLLSTGDRWEVLSVEWLENTVFLVTYAKSPTSSQVTHDCEVYILNKSADNTSIIYTKFMDPCPAFGMMERRGRRWITRLKNWSQFKHLLLMANAPSSDIGTIGLLSSPDSSDSVWTTLALPDASRAAIPLTATSGDTCPLALELDLSSTDSFPSIIGGEQIQCQPTPGLMSYTSEGILVAWRIILQHNGVNVVYDGMVQSRDVVTQEDEAGTSILPTMTSTPVPTAFGSSSTFAAPSAFSAFSSPTVNKSPSVFGAPAFSTPSAVVPSPTPFGAPAFGSSPFGAPAFGSSPFTAPASTASPQPATTPTAPSAFGAPAFGASAFGAPAFGSSPFAPTGTQANLPAVSVTSGGFGGFGSAAVSAFGAKLAFGSVAVTSGFSFKSSPATTAPAVVPSNPVPTSAFGNFSGGSAPMGFGGFSASSTTASPFGGGGTFGSSKTTTTSIFGTSTANATTTTATTSAFAKSGFAPASSKFNDMSRGSRDAEDSDGDDAGGMDEDRVRGDDPPDLEPTRVGLAFGEGVTARTGVAVAAVTSTSSSSPFASAFGSLGFGSSAFPSTTSTSAFGSTSIARAPLPVIATVPVVTSAFGQFKPAPAVSFSFGAPSLSTAPATPTPTATITELPPSIPLVTPPAKVTMNPFASNPQAIPIPTASVSTTTPKSVFGFASSPPAPSVSPSLFGRLGAAPEPSADEDEVDEEREEHEGYGDDEARADEYDAEEEGEEREEDEEVDEDVEEQRRYEEEQAIEREKEDKEAEEQAEKEQADADAAAEQKVALAATAKEEAQAVEEQKREAEVQAKAKMEADAKAKAEVEAAKKQAVVVPVVTPTPSASPFSSNGFSFGAIPSVAPASVSPITGPIIPKAPVKPNPLVLTTSKPPEPALKSAFSFAPSAPRSSSSLSSGTSSIPLPYIAGSPAPPPSFSFASTPAVPMPRPAPPPFSFNTIPAALSIPLPPSIPTTPLIQTPVSASNGFSFSPAPSVAANKAPVALQNTPLASPALVAPTIGRSSPALSTTTTPKLSHPSGTAAKAVVKETGLGGQFLTAYLVLQDEFDTLRQNTNRCKEFVKELSQAYQPISRESSGRQVLHLSSVDLSDQAWSMGDLGQLRNVMKGLEPRVVGIVEDAMIQKRKTTELQSMMLKAQTKREEAARFIRARSDPVFAQMVRVRQLGPEQVENQKKIRLAVESVRSRADQIEDHLVTLKSKVLDSRLGRASFQTPSLDSVNRAVRNISSALSEKTNEIDELNLRLNKLRINRASTTSNSFSRDTPTKASRRLASMDAPHIVSLDASDPRIVATASAALNSERSARILKNALLASRATPLFNQSACTSTSKATNRSKGQGESGVFSDLQLAFAAGPITGDRLPLPRRAPAPVPPKSILALPPTAAPQFNRPTPPLDSGKNSLFSVPAFMAPTSISFTPFTPVTSLPESNLPGSPARQGATRTSSRSHSAAIRLRSNVDSGLAGTSGGSAKTFDWGVLPVHTTAPTMRTRDFISFEGIAQPELVTSSPPEENNTTGDGEEEEYDDNGEGDEEGDEEGEQGSFDDEEEGLDRIAEEDEE